MRIRKKKTNISLWYMMLAFVLLYSVMPIVSRVVSSYLTTYFYMLLIVFVLFAIIRRHGMDSVDEYFALLFPFLIYSILTFFTRSESLILWGYQTLLSWLPIVLGFYLIKYQKGRIAVSAKIIFVAFLLTAITTLIGVIQYPFAARTLATSESSQDVYAVLYSWHNIGGYDFIYTIVLLYPILILAYKQKKINSLFTLILTVLLFVVVLVSEYATALLLIIVSSVFFFLKRDLKLRDLVTLCIVFFVLVILFYTVFSQLLLFLADNIDSDTLADRLRALAGGTEGLEASDDKRIFIYRKSINTFLAHPLFGTFLFGGGGIGGHSTILDTLAQYGIIGLIVLIFMYRKIYRKFLHPFRNQKGYGLIIWFFMQTILLSAINTGLWFWILAVYAPIFLHFIYGNGGKKSENTLDCQYTAQNTKRETLRKKGVRAMDGRFVG